MTNKVNQGASSSDWVELFVNVGDEAECLGACCCIYIFDLTLSVRKNGRHFGARRL